MRRLLTGPVLKLPRLWSATQRCLACFTLVVLSPVLLMMFLAVKLTSKGPFLFRQLRTGKCGQVFSVYKVRTMMVGSEAATRLGVDRSSDCVTRVGRVLRYLKLDELPQLWNVVRGDMNWVGPRPIPIALEEELSTKIPGLGVRRLVRPGLTCVGQILVSDNGLDDDLVPDWEERFYAELHYLENRCITYDCLVIFLSGVFIARRLMQCVVDALRVRRDKGSRNKKGLATIIGGVAIANLDYRRAVAKIEDYVIKGESRYVGICPAHSIVDSLFDPGLRRALRGSDFNTADGMPVVWLQRLLGARQVSRVYGPELMLRLLGSANEKGWRIVLYGGHNGRLSALKSILEREYPRLEIVDAISPPFRRLTEAEDRVTVDRINRARPDLVFVGIGCPKQEHWMLEHRGRIQGTMLGVGAAFDFHCGAVRQAPPWLQEVGMEWLFRLLCEPRRLLGRYLRANPVFVVVGICQLFEHWVLGRSYQIARASSRSESVESGVVS